MIINLSTKRILVISQQRTVLRVLPTRWRRIDMERNYVTVTICIHVRRIIRENKLKYVSLRELKEFIALGPYYAINIYD